MDQESVITEEMRRTIGVTTPPYSFQVEKGAVRKFVAATGDTSPLFWDEEFAKKTTWGSLAVPPTFISPDPPAAARIMGLIRPTNPFRYDIDGGSEWEYLQPVKVGDTLIATAKIVDIYQKQGSPRIGPMVFNIIEVTYRNQVGDPVVVARGTIIYYEGSR